MDNKFRILNVNKSKDDNRDFKYETFFKQKSNIGFCDYRNQLLPVRDQGSQGTCYAQVAACVKEWQENREIYSKNSYFSPQFIYNHRNYFNNNIQDGDDINEDYGMEGRDVMKILKNVGICDEYLYEYGRLEPASEIPESIKSIAKYNVIKSYARIDTLEGLKSSLLKNGPCLIAFPVYNYTNQMWIQNEGDIFQGGHAMTVVGFCDENEYFIIRNSWGKNWCDEGYCYYYYKDWNSHWECWVTVDLENESFEDEHKLDEEKLPDNLEDKEKLDEKKLPDNLKDKEKLDEEKLPDNLEEKEDHNNLPDNLEDDELKKNKTCWDYIFN